MRWCLLNLVDGQGYLFSGIDFCLCVRFIVEVQNCYKSILFHYCVQYLPSFWILGRDAYLTITL